MKKLFMIFGSAITMLFVGIIIFVPFNHWYAVRYVKNEEDVDIQIRFFLYIVMPLFFFMGGVLGNIIYKKILKIGKRDKKKLTNENNKNNGVTLDIEHK